MARIERLWVKRFDGGPMDPVDAMDLVEGQGIVGNADQGGWRQVTIISRERWDRAERELGATVDPALRRANLLVSGLDLLETRGATITVGDVVLEVRGETRPCRQMDEAHAGLQDALDADWGGGAFAFVKQGGTIRVGDEVSLTPATESAAN